MKLKPLRLSDYAATAVAARTADESVAAGLALAASAAGTSSATAGALIASTSVVHAVAGPLVGARLDASPARRLVVVSAPLYFAGLIGTVFLLLDRAPTIGLVALCVAGGFAGPVLLGGLSATLVDIAPPPHDRPLRVDAVSYNIAAIGAPLVAAATIAWLGASWMAALLGGLAVVASGFALRLPIRPSVRTDEVSGFAAIGTLWTRRPLRLVTAATTVAFVGVGGIPLVLVARADQLGSEGLAGVALAAAAVCGLCAAWLPLAPDRAATRVVVTLSVAAAGLGLAAVAPSAWVVVAALAVVGAADGALLPAVLLVRSTHTDAGSRGAVFTTAASLKIAAGAAGAAGAGVALEQVSPAPVFWSISAIHALGAVIALPARHSLRTL